MEKILLLEDTVGDQYPAHFKAFLEHCAQNIRCFGSNDYLFAAVYFMVLETGFTPRGLAGSFRRYSTDFDIQKLRSVTQYTEDQIRISSNPNRTKCIVYRIALNLGTLNCSKCELQGVPTADNTHLIVNLILQDPQTVKSLCLNTADFVVNKETPGILEFDFKDLKALSMLVKNEMSVVIKDLVTIFFGEGCSANLSCLPEEVQKKIVYFLKYDPVSLQFFASTCTYFRNFINQDSKLWEEICFHEYTGWELNKVLQEIGSSSDGNVFRAAFLRLKKEDLKGLKSF